MKKSELIKYWQASSDQDFSAMGSLYRNGHYAWSLFLGHLVLEKRLKALYVKKVDANIPFTQDLVKIAVTAGLDLPEKQKDFLDAVTTFNIKARYPDHKGRF